MMGLKLNLVSKRGLIFLFNHAFDMVDNRTFTFEAIVIKLDFITPSLNLFYSQVFIINHLPAPCMLVHVLEIIVGL